jgi:NAD-dependent DNA ligase
METAEQIELIKNQIETHREQFLDVLMFAFDVEEISSEKHLQLIENLKSYEIVQKKYIQALESEQIKFDLFCRI